jgi:hypothetical protein
VLSIKRIVLLSFATFCCGCGTQAISPETGNRVWSSDYHPVRVSYGPPWTVIQPYIDSADKLLVGFIDNSDGKSFTVKVGRDVNRDVVSDAEYNDAVRNQMLSAHSQNRLMDEGDVEFHGKSFHRMRFRMHTEKWGELCLFVYTHRTGERVIVVQIAFPLVGSSENADALPPTLEALDSSVQLFDEENSQ